MQKNNLPALIMAELNNLSPEASKLLIETFARKEELEVNNLALESGYSGKGAATQSDIIVLLKAHLMSGKASRQFVNNFCRLRSPKDLNNLLVKWGYLTHDELFGYSWKIMLYKGNPVGAAGRRATTVTYYTQTIIDMLSNI